MAADSFMEAMQRLKEIHEKEVLGMQAKLTELTMEKCRDAQRIEELFSKNHVLREQHKILNENIKVLENRLRAGLCDRCTVTQDLAKKKQLEFENSIFHSVQQISSLTTETNNLKEENRSLLEELKKLKSMDEKNKHSRAYTPETNLGPDSPCPLKTAVNQKNGPEQMSKDSETQENLSENQMTEERSTAASKLSPGGKGSQTAGQDTSLPERCVSGAQKSFVSKPNQNHQRISNQLHGTIAVMRPGFKSGQTGTGTSHSFSKRNHNNEIYSKVSGVDSYKVSSQLESLKKVIPEEQLGLLSQHLTQRHIGQRGTGISRDAMSRYLLAKSREEELVRKDSQDDWEEKAAMAELHGAVLYMREQEFRSRLTQPDQRETLHYFLTRQHQGQRSPKSPDISKSQGKEGPKEGRISLLDVLSKQLKNNKHQDSNLEGQDWNDKGCVEPEKDEEEDFSRDKPLDLSDTRRMHNSNHSDNRRELMFETYKESPTYSKNSSPSRDSSFDLLHTGGQAESRLPAKSVKSSDHERTEPKCYKEVPILYLEKETETAASNKSAKGQKRGCEIVQDEEEEMRDVMMGEANTSCSETETENLRHSTTESHRDDVTQNKSRGGNKFGKKGSQVSKKSNKRKRRVRELQAESDTSQEDETTSTPSRKDFTRETPA